MGGHRIGQAQFWDVRDFSRDYGDGQAHECLSTIISEWDKPGILYGKTARECTKDEIVAELWAQLKDGLNDSGKTTLRDEDRLGWFMDPAVTGLGGPDPQNREQLLIHPTGTLYHRPSARTAVPNFFLAGDYVRTDVDLATMEAPTSPRDAPSTHSWTRTVRAPNGVTSGSCSGRRRWSPEAGRRGALSAGAAQHLRPGVAPGTDLRRKGRCPERLRPFNRNGVLLLEHPHRTGRRVVRQGFRSHEFRR